MSTSVEVFADITCPFTHVGLKRVLAHIAEIDHPIDIIVRAWPLEWVNDTGLDVVAVKVKAKALSTQLGVDDFSGLRTDRWPATTIPALNLAAAGYADSPSTGLAISVALREALFENGHDVSDPAVLGAIAATHGVAANGTERDSVASSAVRADYEDGLAKGVSGSPHFWVGRDDFFCPALDLGHDADGNLTARIDTEGLATFFARIEG
jgi:predicted DsbA family dithiol-disulfide isomerase